MIDGSLRAATNCAAPWFLMAAPVMPGHLAALQLCYHTSLKTCTHSSSDDPVSRRRTGPASRPNFPLANPIL